MERVARGQGRGRPSFTMRTAVFRGSTLDSHSPRSVKDAHRSAPNLGPLLMELPLLGTLPDSGLRLPRPMNLSPVIVGGARRLTSRDVGRPGRLARTLPPDCPVSWVSGGFARTSNLPGSSWVASNNPAPVHDPARRSRCGVRRSALQASAALVLVCGLSAGSPPRGPDPAQPPPPPVGSLGYPSRAPDLDVLPGFRQPPPGYGQVPFWWWTGDPLDKDRLLWQIDQLHAKGVAGVQVNYAHEDSAGWPTYPAQPELFSDAWWDVWRFVAGECGQRQMGIGLSGYTLDWPNQRSYVSRTIYSEPALVGRELQVVAKATVGPGQTLRLDVPAPTIGVWAYPASQAAPALHSRDLAPCIQNQRLEWTPSDGPWEIWVFGSVPKPGALNPLHPQAGQRVIEKFFQPFQDHAPDRSARGLNYFFHDELQFGVGDHVWTDDFAEQFLARKGYNVFDALPALFADVGPRTPKARLDYLDVRMQLIQERYFIPIFQWHWSRGLIYGCDQGSRGLDPMEFGDYFSAVRWYTAPGHDTPGGRADLIKGKVSSSIAQLYRRPRVWLEGYHSLGWGATPARLMQATCENYLYGCNLLNLHGLYYTTHGGFWEWAPPCYHFRMPYWEHMGTFLKYFERLSYLMSQGTHHCDLAILYPVTQGQAGLDGARSTTAAFQLATRLFQNGRDFVFIDDESIARATFAHGRLHVADASYRVLLLPNPRAVRWSTLLQAQAFRRAGGMVVALDALPEASDRAGREDPELDQTVRDLFGATAAEVGRGARPGPQPHPSGGLGAALLAGEGNWAALTAILHRLPLDVQSTTTIQAVHRKIGPRDVYLLLGAPAGAECTFQARGRAEWWDPWTGSVHPIHTAQPTASGTRLQLPLGPDQAQLIVFSPTPSDLAVTRSDLAEIRDLQVQDGVPHLAGYARTQGPVSATVTHRERTCHLQGEALPSTTLTLDGPWEFQLQPTLDNRWGDFRLPITQPMIGPEARTFRYADESLAHPGWEKAGADDTAWPEVTHGFGPQFWILGPLPADSDPTALDRLLADQTQIDPKTAVPVGDRSCVWSPYAFSWRWGKEGDPGHQGYHGLKGNVTNAFLCLGQPRDGLNETLYGPDPGGTRYYLWTTIRTDQPTRAALELGGLQPAAIFLNGRPVPQPLQPLELAAGPNPVLLRYETPGRGFVVARRLPGSLPSARTPLAMPWHDDPSVLRFDPQPANPAPAGWYRFTAPPGLRGFTIIAQGQPTAWVDGFPGQVRSVDAPSRPDGASTFRVDVANPPSGPAKVAVRIEQRPGFYGGAALPEPITLDCGPGAFPAGDWSQGTALESYSGGAWYRRDLHLDLLPPDSRVLLDLGDVVATAEVRINGRAAGVRVAPPWTVDLGPHVRAGSNRLEVLVYNTLANHYLTIPTRYRGSLRSGLLGPVRLSIQPLTILRSTASSP